MNKRGLLIIAIGLSACAVFNESAYESGWNNKVSENTYAVCSKVWVKKDLLNPNYLEQLVKSEYLSSIEGERAKASDVRAGDSECMAYASFGLNRSKILFTKNRNDQLIEKVVTYSCESSQAVCPGVRITIVDGHVKSVASIN